MTQVQNTFHYRTDGKALIVSQIGCDIYYTLYNNSSYNYDKVVTIYKYTAVFTTDNCYWYIYTGFGLNYNIQYILYYMLYTMIAYELF